MKKLQVGSTYKCTKEFISGTHVIEFTVKQAHDDEYYIIEIKKHTLRPSMVGEVSPLYRTSNLFTLWNMEEVVATKFSIRGKKKLTALEMEVEDLIKHVQNRVTKEHIMRAIDEALDTGNRNLFMVLTAQLNELEGVTA